MTVKQTIGLVMLALPHILLFIFIANISGWIAAFSIYGAIVIFFGWVVLAGYLLSGR